MNGLEEMRKRVLEILARRNKNLIDHYYFNKNRNYIIMEEKFCFLLKWNTPFYAAGTRAYKGSQKGAGVTIATDVYHDFKQNFDMYPQLAKIVLFNWSEAGDKIYACNFGDFISKSVNYTQESGELVNVFMIDWLYRWD